MFGGYHGYMATPMIKVLRHHIRLVAKWQAEAEMHEQQEHDMKRQRMLDGSRG